MLRVGQRNKSRFLLMLFGIWVLSPFVLLLVINLASKSWAAVTRATFYTVMLVISLASLAVYAYVAFGPPMAKPASAFLMVPLGSWLLIAIAAMVARRRSPGTGGG